MIQWNLLFKCFYVFERRKNGFLSNKYGKTNDYFQYNIKKEEFKEAFERKIKELGLRGSDAQEPIGREMNLFKL